MVSEYHRGVVLRKLVYARIGDAASRFSHRGVHGFVEDTAPVRTGVCRIAGTIE